MGSPIALNILHALIKSIPGTVALCADQLGSLADLRIGD